MKTKLKATQVRPGLTVEVVDHVGLWTVLSHHPLNAHWWLHRWDGDEHFYSFARYNDMEQVIETAGVSA